MSINVDLLRRTLVHIETHPESWDQTSWAVQYYKGGEPCGTAFCFAGWAVQLAGHEVEFNDAHVPTPDGGDLCGALYCDGGSISEVAARELGLDEDQADALFSGGNTLDDLRRNVSELLAEAATEVTHP